MKRPQLEDYKPSEINDGQDMAEWYEAYSKALEKYADHIEQINSSNDIHNVSETYTADQMRKMFFAGLFHDTVVDESEDGEVYESAYNDVMSRTKSSSR